MIMSTDQLHERICVALGTTPEDTTRSRVSAVLGFRYPAEYARALCRSQQGAMSIAIQRAFGRAGLRAIREPTGEIRVELAGQPSVLQQRILEGSYGNPKEAL